MNDTELIEYYANVTPAARMPDDVYSRTIRVAALLNVTGPEPGSPIWPTVQRLRDDARARCTLIGGQWRVRHQDDGTAGRRAAVVANRDDGRPR